MRPSDKHHAMVRPPAGWQGGCRGAAFKVGWQHTREGPLHSTLPRLVGAPGYRGAYRDRLGGMSRATTDLATDYFPLNCKGHHGDEMGVSERCLRPSTAVPAAAAEAAAANTIRAARPRVSPYCARYDGLLWCIRVCREACPCDGRCKGGAGAACRQYQPVRA